MLRVESLWVLPLVGLLAGGCASYEPSSAVVREKSEFALVEKEGVRAGADPYVDAAEQENAFDADLDKADVIAVHVFVENGLDKAVLVRPSDMQLKLPDGQAITPSSASKTANKVGEEGSVVGATIAFGLIGALAASSAEDKARTARIDDYESKAFESARLEAGQTEDGVVFFLPPNSWPGFDKAELSVHFIEPDTGESRVVPVPLRGLSFEPEE